MHEHGHHHATKNIRAAFFLNLAFTVFEIIGGLYVNSVAILSDALHDLGDSFSLGLSWFLERTSGKKPDQTYTFGYQRFSLLGALINSIVLIGGGAIVLYLAIDRFINPEETKPEGMIIFALVGVLVNGIAAWRLSRGKSMNERVLYLHLLEDVLGWVAILIVSFVILFWEVHFLDPALSVLITFYVLWNVLKRLKSTMKIFLQGSPENVNIREINEKLQSLPDVASTHHVHSWTLDGEHHVLTAHLKLNKGISLQALQDLKCDLRALVREYGFEHSTIELEFWDEECSVEKESHEH